MRGPQKGNTLCQGLKSKITWCKSLHHSSGLSQATGRRKSNSESDKSSFYFHCSPGAQHFMSISSFNALHNRDSDNYCLCPRGGWKGLPRAIGGGAEKPRGQMRPPNGFSHLEPEDSEPGRQAGQDWARSVWKESQDGQRGVDTSGW